MATDDSSTAGKKTPPPTPPRLTGDYTTDAAILTKWIWAFYQSTVLESGLLDPTFQSDAGTFDPNNLPDPANTSIARAQDTANHAYQATIANTVAVARLPLLEGSVTLSNASNVATFTFTTPQTTTDYVVLVACRDFSGTPSASSFVVARITRMTGNFVVTFAAAPGAGNSITFDLVVLPPS